MASKNYFAENINMNPFVNTWSLSVEIQFYLCFPFIICPPVPNKYPFIVNDPGEGSQAKRRTPAIIIDNLT